QPSMARPRRPPSKWCPIAPRSRAMVSTSPSSNSRWKRRPSEASSARSAPQLTRSTSCCTPARATIAPRPCAPSRSLRPTAPAFHSRRWPPSPPQRSPRSFSVTMGGAAFGYMRAFPRARRFPRCHSRPTLRSNGNDRSEIELEHLATRALTKACARMQGERGRIVGGYQRADFCRAGSEGSVHHPIHNRARYAESSRLSAHANRVDQYVLASLITIQQSPDEGSVMTTSIEPDSRPVAPRVLARMASLLDIHGHGVGETREGVIVKIAQPSDRELAEWDSHEATWNLRGLCLRLAHERQEGVDHTEVHSDERAVQAGLAIATANTKPGCT